MDIVAKHWAKYIINVHKGVVWDESADPNKDNFEITIYECAEYCVGLEFFRREKYIVDMKIHNDDMDLATIYNDEILDENKLAAAINNVEIIKCNKCDKIIIEKILCYDCEKKETKTFIENKINYHPTSEKVADIEKEFYKN